MKELRLKIAENAAKVGLAFGAGYGVDTYTANLRDLIASGKLDPNWLQYRLGYWMGDFPATLAVAVGTNMLFSNLVKTHTMQAKLAQGAATAVIASGFAYVLEHAPLGFLGTLDTNDMVWGGFSGVAAGLLIGYGVEAYTSLRARRKA